MFVCTLAYYMQYKTYLASHFTANCCETYVEMIDIALPTLLEITEDYWSLL